MLHQIRAKRQMVIDRGKRREIPNEAKPVENINKNSLNFLKICPLKKEVPPSQMHVSNRILLD